MKIWIAIECATGFAVDTHTSVFIMSEHSFEAIADRVWDRDMESALLLLDTDPAYFIVNDINDLKRLWLSSQLSS